MLTLRGVSATNQNDWSTAKQDFLQAYSLDSDSAFSLNNLGYVAEKDGDLETAQFYTRRPERPAMQTPALDWRPNVRPKARISRQSQPIATRKLMAKLKSTVRLDTGKQVRSN